MNYVQKSFKGAIWLSFFNFISQIYSWVITILIARVLTPNDYGLMDMATIFTAYIAIFNELGLGAAIIQRKDVNENELSSLFWFVSLIGIVFAISSIIIAYPTAWLFDETRLIPITQLVSLVFVITALMIIPLNILNRNAEFKIIGFIELIAKLTASTAMLLIAYNGGGVWTLIWGTIILKLTQTILMYYFVKWRPKFHFNLNEIKPYMKFGLNIAGTRSVNYITNKADRFFAGKFLGATSLGYYSFAIQLASLPTEKIVSIIQRVTFPLFSRYQDNIEDFKYYYLKVIKLVALLTFPLYIGGAYLGNNLIPLILGEKWVPIIDIFIILSISQIFISILTFNKIALNALGLPHKNFYYSLIIAIFLSISFYLASQFNIFVMTIPWITILPIIIVIYTYYTIRKINLTFLEFLINIKNPILGSIFIILIFIIINKFNYIIKLNNFNLLILKLFSSIIIYIYFIYKVEKNNFNLIFNILKTKKNNI